MAVPDPRMLAKKPEQTAGYKAPSFNSIPSPTASAANAPSASKSVPNPDQVAAQAWINNPDSGQGGMDAYTKTQNQRFQTASASNDADLLGRLQADSQRVGYGIDPYNPPAPAAGQVNTPAPAANQSSYVSSTPTSPAAFQYSEWQKKQDELMSKYEALMNTKFEYNPEQDARYTAFRDLSKSRAEIAAQDANKNTLETMNERGILGSSLTASQLSQNENKFRQQAETEALAAVPQYQAEARADYQEKLRNAGDLLKFAAGRSDAAGDMVYRDSRASRGDMESDRAYGRGTLESDRNFNRGALESDRNFNRDTLESDRNYDRQVSRDAAADSQFRQTLEYQQMSDQQKREYQHARDSIEDERYQAKFDEDVRRFGLQYAADEAYRTGQLRLQESSQAQSAANAAASQGLAQDRFAWEKDPNNPSNQPKEPKVQSVNLNSIASSLSQRFVATDPDTGKKVVSDPEGLERTILSQQMSDAEYEYLYNYFGLKLPQ